MTRSQVLSGVSPAKKVSAKKTQSRGIKKAEKTKIIKRQPKQVVVFGGKIDDICENFQTLQKERRE